MMLEINAYMDELAELCRKYGVKRLELFGSAARGDFAAQHSDIDFVVDFAEEHPLGAFEQYFGFKEALEQLFKRSVDLVEEQAIRNPYFRQAIAQDRTMIYGTGS
ncbi:MAG TPA: nucleotidyltransferase domain-containing protein [Anaerolineae bacterium]|nr:nucleotidyltransferase domain-containing protein [Anaerolineae bacterium]HQH39042.1 nucleotidyltransferase domain-containing protein [Anaerolineae bacterium]